MKRTCVAVIPAPVAGVARPCALVVPGYAAARNRWAFGTTVATLHTEKQSMDPRRPLRTPT